MLGKCRPGTRGQLFSVELWDRVAGTLGRSVLGNCPEGAAESPMVAALGVP